MATSFLPQTPVEGEIVIAPNGRKLKNVGGLWRAIPLAALPSGGGGTDTVTVQNMIDNSIAALNLGSIVTSDLFVSSAAPDNSVGKDGDIWLQTT